MPFQKIEPFVNPGIEPGLHVTRDLPYDVFAIFQPLQFRPRGRRPNRLLTFFALKSESHRLGLYRIKRKGPRTLREPSPGNVPFA
jgi:hypothetical protein